MISKIVWLLGKLETDVYGFWNSYSYNFPLHFLHWVSAILYSGPGHRLNLELKFTKSFYLLSIRHTSYYRVWLNFLVHKRLLETNLLQHHMKTYHLYSNLSSQSLGCVESYVLQQILLVYYCVAFLIHIYNYVVSIFYLVCMSFQLLLTRVAVKAW